MQQFVPLTDEMLYEHPEAIPDRLVPFDPDLPCLHQLASPPPPQGDQHHES